jgi:hypothetical protein
MENVLTFSGVHTITIAAVWRQLVAARTDQYVQIPKATAAVVIHGLRCRASRNHCSLQVTPGDDDTMLLSLVVKNQRGTIAHDDAIVPLSSSGDEARELADAMRLEAGRRGLAILPYSAMLAVLRRLGYRRQGVRSGLSGVGPSSAPGGVSRARGEDCTGKSRFAATSYSAESPLSPPAL